MPLSRFVLTLDAVERVTAEDRLSFVTDMSTVTSSMFPKKGTNPVRDHVKLLQEAIKGEVNGDQS